MNWSDFSRFVGDIFGAPLAVEGLLAFFLSLCSWACGSSAGIDSRRKCTSHPSGLPRSALCCRPFILAANSFMQHPTSYTYNPETNRVELNNFFEMLFQDTAKITFWHTISAAFITGGAVVAGISAWLLVRVRVQMSRGPH